MKILSKNFMNITKKNFFKNSVTVLNRLHDVKVNFKKIPTYEKQKQFS